MKQLHKLQENFQNYLLGSQHTIETYVSHQKADFANQRLHIYKDGYQLRLVEALQQDYSGVVFLLGKEEFTEMATQYVNKKPSQHYSINEFGKSIPRFLKQTSPYSKHPALAEMASFELAFNNAAHTVDAPVLSAEAISKISQEKWPKLKFTPHPSLQVLKLAWNVVDIWRAVIDKDSQNSPPPLKKGQTCTWIIWQKGIDTYYLMLQSAEAFILQSMQKNLPVAKICDGLCRWLSEEQVPQYLANTILRWLNDKLLSEMNL